MKKTLCLILIALSCMLQAQVVERSLDGCKWKFRQKNESKWHRAGVPGTVHTDLLRNKMIPDPFFAGNEKKVQWIENEDWEYATSFSVSQEELKESHIELQFGGLDTYADVYVNDSLVLQADNMFRSWHPDVKKYLHEGKNSLYILFASAVKKGKAAAAALNYTLPGDEKVFARKAQYQYGWDWGPRLVTCGIWKDVKLVCWNDARILDVQAIQRSLSDSLAELEFVCTIKSDVEANAYLDIAHTDDLGGEINSKIRLKKGTDSYTLTYTVRHPQRWWCNGLGFPTLYDFLISLTYDSRFLDIKNVNIGLRTLELVQERDSAGASFYFKLNGIPVFMKGANYIPPDDFLPRVTKEKYAAVVKNAADANMNMLRVWGGGVYADDEFYSQCDRQGILVWQDFMFACAMYPGDQHFRENVAAEVKEQIGRLRNHPCIALWCGNNEIDEGWHNWGWQRQYKYSPDDSSHIATDYLFLFQRLIPGLVAADDPVRSGSYQASSPLIGWGHKESLLQGDSHYWGVWWGNEPFEIYKQKTGRFMSEYGFQGMPALSTFKKITAEKNISLGSPAVISHQKHPAGYQIIRTYMERDYHVPADFENYDYVSQLLQAEGLKTAIDAHRSAKPYCMGTLYWQLNDCWPAVSWSSMDYYGNRKAAYYEAVRSYATVLLSVSDQQDTISVHIINDGADTLKRDLYIQLTDFYGNDLSVKRLAVQVLPFSNSVYYTVAKKELGRFDPSQTLLSVSLLIPKTFEGANTLYYFLRPKELHLNKTKVQVQETPGQRSQCITLSTDVLAKNVFVTIKGESVNLSDNFFDLMPGQPRTICLPPGRKIRHLEKKVIVRSLVDTYSE